MCSQYEIKSKLSHVANELITNPHNITIDDEVDYSSHIYPFSKAPVIINHDGSLEFILMNYSLIPHWSDSARPRFATYNARLDRTIENSNSLQKIYEIPSWRVPFSKNRCLVPLNGFYESCHSGSHKGHMVKFSSKIKDTLFAAGIYDKWFDPNSKQTLYSFAIITDEPNDFILSVGHDRQPVFLEPTNHAQWLDSKNLNINDAYDFLKSEQEHIEYHVDDMRKLKQEIDECNQLTLF